MIHVKSWQATLGGSERGHEIFEWYKGFLNFLWKERSMCTWGYTDADYAGDMDKRRSTSGYVFIFTGGVVSWQSCLQNCTSMSTIEAKYIVASKACHRKPYGLLN